nr:MAG TPA_asm: hypothetical protein [Caudoviricetes sp.]
MKPPTTAIAIFSHLFSFLNFYNLLYTQYCILSRNMI